MTDIISLGIQIALSDIDKATKALDKLADASVGVEKATSGINKATKETAKTQEEAANKASLQAQREARAQRAVEQALLAKEKTVTQAAKTSAITAAAEIKAQNALQANIRAQARLQEGVARASAESAKRLDVLASKQGAQAALTAKYTSQTQAIQERASAYALNQQSLIENRTLATQARITAGAQRQALMQEKFEFQKAQAAERAARRQADSVGILKGAYQSVRDIAIGAFAVGGVAGGVSSIIRTADTLTLLDSRLKLATKSQEDFVKTQTALRESSLRTGLNLEAQIAGYTQLERSTRALGLSSNQLTFLTESFGKAAIVSGADTASYQSALTQLNQGFASGVIRGQEFNSVAEQAPAIMEALANGLRGSNKEFDDLEKKGFIGVAALRKLAGEGKLVNSVTIPALIEGLKVTNQQFDSLPLTVQRATEKVKTAYQIWLSDQNNIVGGTQTLAKALSSLSENFSEVVSTATTVAAVVGTAIAGRLVGAIVSATKSSTVWAAATGIAVKEELALANAAAVAAAATEKEAAAQLANVRAKTLGLTVTKELTVAQSTHASAVLASSSALARYDAALKASSVAATSAAAATGIFNKALLLIGGVPGAIAIGVITIVQYWDDIRIAMGDTKREAESAGRAIEEAISRGDRAAAASIINEKRLTAQKARADQEAAVKQLRAEERRLGLIDVGPTQGTYTPGYADFRQREGIRRDQERNLRPVDRTALITARNAVQAANATLSETEIVLSKATNARAMASEKQAEALAAPFYQATPTAISGPTPEVKPTTVRALGAGESELTAIRGRVAAYEDEIKLALKLGTAKDNLNEHEVRAYQIQEKIDELDKGAKNYAELKSTLELTLAQEKRAGVLKKELDAIQERNKAVIDWRKEVEKLTEKQENLAKYTAIGLDAKAETSQEIAARKTKENYEAALQRLKAIDSILNAPQGVSTKEKRDAIDKALGISPAKQEASFEDQLKATDAAIQFSRDQGDLDHVAKLEADKTAILEAQAAKRNAIREEENNALKNNLSTLQSTTGSVLEILKNAGAEQSGIYKALFAANKAFAIANSIVSIQKAYADAFATGVTLPEKLANFAIIATQTAGIVSTIASTDVKFAKGAAFDGPVGAGSGVISTPTTFPMSGGKTGMLGEAGSEAILPLSRDANGRLGVNLNGGANSSSNVQQNNITINVTGGNTNEETAGVISRELLKTMERIADSRISNATRPTGILAR